MKFPKPTRIKDPTLLARVRMLSCLLCRRWPSCAHHVTTRGAGGNDTGDNVMPLCVRHHKEWHDTGVITMTEKYPKVFRWLKEHDRWEILLSIEKIKKNFNLKK